MAANPTFSILIPFHNGQSTIGETITSIQMQQNASYEIIIADDRSSYEARCALYRLVKKEPRIRVIHCDGAGPSAARNTAAAAATGEFLCFLDADDCLRPGALETYERCLNENPDIGVVFGRVQITPTPLLDGGVITPYCPVPNLAQIIGENRVCTASNIVTRSEAFCDIGGFDETLSHAEDQEWLARAYLHPDWRLEGVREITLDYRTSAGGLSSDLRRMEKGWRQMISAVRQRSQSITLRQLIEVRGFFYRYLARRALRLGASRTDGFIFMVRALAAHPLLLFREVGRTWPTLFGAVAVMIFGVEPFRKVFR